MKPLLEPDLTPLANRMGTGGQIENHLHTVGVLRILLSQEADLEL